MDKGLQEEATGMRNRPQNDEVKRTLAACYRLLIEVANRYRLSHEVIEKDESRHDPRMEQSMTTREAIDEKCATALDQAAGKR